MRYMIIVKGTKDTEAGVKPDAAMLAAMADYHEKLERAGVLLDASGLKPTSQGWRIRYSGGNRTLIDGPFTEAKELIAGYTMIQVKSRVEALEWAKQFPNPYPSGQGEIEVRELYELDDLGEGEGIERFRALEAARRR